MTYFASQKPSCSQHGRTTTQFCLHPSPCLSPNSKEHNFSFLLFFFFDTSQSLNLFFLWHSEELSYSSSEASSLLSPFRGLLSCGCLLTSIARHVSLTEDIWPFFFFFFVSLLPVIDKIVSLPLWWLPLKC